MLRKEVGKPLYLQLKALLAEHIESGKYSVNNMLPEEQDLAGEYGVSRVVVRKCIEALIEEGYVTRIAGRNTIVNRKKIRNRLGDLLGIREELLGTNKDVKTVELFKGCEPVKQEVKRLLGIENTELVYAFARLFLVEGKPILVNYSYISIDKGGLIDVMDLNKVVIFSHLEQCGYKISYAEHEIFAGICGVDEAKYLNYAAGLPVLIRRRTTYLEGGYPILYDTCIYRGDAYQYSIRLYRKK